MKQRLLLALLMLMTAAGWVKAADHPMRIVIPAGDTKESVTIKLTGTGFESNAYPNLRNASDKDIAPTQTTGTLIWTIAYTNSAQTVYFRNGESTATWANSKDLALTIDGKVSSFAIESDGGSLAKNLKALMFTNNDGALTTLSLSKTEGLIGWVPALKTLNVPEGSLKVIPQNQGGQITDYVIGAQTLANPLALEATVQTDHTVKIAIPAGSVFGNPVPTVFDLIWAADVSAEKGTDGSYTFKKNGVFTGGTFACQLQVTDGVYKGVTIKNAQVTVDEPTFTLRKDIPAITTVSVTKNGTAFTGTEVKSGDELIFTIVGFDAAKHVVSTLEFSGLGLTAQQAESGIYTFQVLGTADPSFKIVVADKPQEKEKSIVSLFSNEGGTASVTISGQSVVGEELDVNRDIRITATPDAGYLLEAVKLNGTAITLTKGTVVQKTVAGANHVEAYFKLGATVQVEHAKVEANGAEVTSATLEPGTTITITPTSKSGNKVVGVTVNGKPATASGKTYTATVAAGVNTVVVTYESTKATVSKNLFGLSDDQVSIAPASGWKEGTKLTVTINNLTASQTVEKVLLNGAAMTSGANNTFTGTLKAGANVVTVYASVAPTLSKKVEGVKADSHVSIKNVSDTELRDGSSLTLGEPLAITITDLTAKGYRLEAASFNGTPLTVGKNVVKAVAGVNYVYVKYAKIAAPEVGTPKIVNEAGGSAQATIQAGKIVITATPNKGYGLQYIQVNDGMTQVDYAATNPNQATATPRPGMNTVTVVFTDRAVVDWKVVGVKASAKDVTVSLVNGGSAVNKSQTYEIGTSVAVAVKEKAGYKIQSVLVNGKKPSTQSADLTASSFPLAVGLNYIEVAYVSTKATEVRQIPVGGTIDKVTYYTAAGTEKAITGFVQAEPIALAVESQQAIKQVYFNDTELAFSGGRYTGGKANVGVNTLYVFFKDAALVKSVFAAEDIKSVVVTKGTTTIGEDTELNEGDEIVIKVTPQSRRSVEAVWFNGNKLNTEAFAKAQTFTTTVQSGLNTIYVDAENIETAIVLTQTGDGEVTMKDAKGKEVTDRTNTLVAGDVITLTATPKGDFTHATVTLNGASTGVVEMGKNTYEITLSAGVNNINVTFTKALQASLLIKYDAEVSAVRIDEKSGDLMVDNVANGQVVEVPSEAKLKISFKVKDVANKKISAVVNGRLYSELDMDPSAADASGYVTYTIGKDNQLNDADNALFLPQALQSVLRIYVKTLKEIKVDVSGNTFVYDGEAKPVVYTTDPAQVDLKVEYSQNQGAQWREEPFTDAGTYWVRFSRAEDDQYRKLDDIDKNLVIEKAELVVTSLPTLTTPTANNQKYEISGGQAGYWSKGAFVDVPGEFTVTGTHQQGGYVATVNFTATEADDNLDASAVNGLKVYYKVNSYKGKFYTLSVDQSEVPFILRRGKAVLDSDDLALPQTDAITVVYAAVPGFKYALYNVNSEGKETLINGWENDGFWPEEASKDETALTIKLKATDIREALALQHEITIPDAIYNGKPQPFTPDQTNCGLVAGKNKQKVTDSRVYKKLIVTYSQNGVAVIEPVHAGTYDVTVTYVADEDYKDFTATTTYTIARYNLDEAGIGDPIATPIAAGQTLRNSYLTGAAEVPGQYVWYEASNVPTADNNGGVDQPAKFVPTDLVNFSDFRNVGKVRVPILTGAQLITYSANLGTISVADGQGNRYSSGSRVAPGTNLTITATPLDNMTLEIESMSVTANGKTQSVAGSSTTIVFPEKGNVEVYASFKLKDNDPIIIPEGQYAVVLPKSVRGAKLSKTGVYAVERGNAFEFTVTTLESDKEKVRVTVNGTPLAATAGKYVIEQITAKQEVSVTVANPTEVKVEIPRAYKTEEGKLYGKVTVKNRTANDGKVYFNDALELVAFPETGVKFVSWSDKESEQVRTYTVTGDVTLQALFSGNPTGIASIGTVEVYGGSGSIFFRGIGEAQVTLIGMDGRYSRRTLQGDSRVAAPAGVYVVLLEQGERVIRRKVVVH